MRNAKQRRTKLIFLGIATAVAFYFCYLLAEPFFRSIVAAAILATLLHPWFRRLRERFGNANWAATLSLVIVIVAFIGPAILLGILVEKELVAAYQWLRTNTEAQNGWPAALSLWATNAAGWIGVHIGVSPDTLREAFLSRLNEISGSFVQKAANILGGLGTGIVSLVIMFVAFFFLLREGSRIVRGGASLLPLDADEIDILIARVEATIQANVVGALAVAAVQGSLLALAFWFLGISSPLLWALIAAMCSVIPIVGSSVVWIPAIVHLIATGSWVKGLILLGWAGGLVSLADNIIRPWVLSDRVNLPPLVLFFALLGGVELFGVLGIFLGPVILSLAISIASLFFSELRAQGDLKPQDRWESRSESIQG
ncbi:MAG TPA: AI-2E family transporter [Bryobacteraceae bacterium]|nr:AI-2E family transporter [Bryobacteraceae bacterium]